METTGYSGVTPDGPSDDRTAGSDPGSSRFVSAPTFEPAPAPVAEPERDAVAPSPLDDPLFGSAPFEPARDEPVVTLLAPEPEGTAPAALPMSLAIAAEEAASAELPSEPESRSSSFEAFYDASQSPEDNPWSSAATDPGAPTDTGVTDGPWSEGSPFADDTTDDTADEPTLSLAESEAQESAYNRVSTEPVLGGEDIVLVDLLLTMLERGASDLHLTAGARPAVRVNGELSQMDEFPVLTPPVIQRVMYAAITQRQREVFEETLLMVSSNSHRSSGVHSFIATTDSTARTWFDSPRQVSTMNRLR